MIFSLFLLVMIALLFMLTKKFFGPAMPQLPVLMYHKVSDDGSKDYLTIPSEMLERQFHYLQRHGFTPILLSQLVDFVKRRKPLPDNPILITFDDGYRNNYTVMYPLLKKYGMKANIFLVPTLFQDSNGVIDENGYLCPEDILTMDGKSVEFGLHSYDHSNYKNLSLKELDADLTKNKQSLQALGIRYQPCLAFPYGAYPKRNFFKLHYFFETLALNNIDIAFRIGNRVNRLPLSNPLLIQRLDIKGDMSFIQFAAKLQKSLPRQSKQGLKQIPAPSPMARHVAGA